MLVRQYLAAGQLPRAMTLLQKIATPSSADSRTRESSLVLAVSTLDHVLALERQSGVPDHITALTAAAVSCSRDLAQLSSRYEALYVKWLALSGRETQARAYLEKNFDLVNPDHRAAAMVEFVRWNSDRDATVPLIAAELHTLIRRHPQLSQLRINYADLLLYAEQYDAAEQTLTPVSGTRSGPGPVLSRRAWLRAVQRKDLDRAAEFAAAAVRTESEEPSLLEIQSRVLIAQGEYASAMKTLQSILPGKRSLAGEIYLLATLAALDRTREADLILGRILNDCEMLTLRPADRELLRVAASQIRHTVTASR